MKKRIIKVVACCLLVISCYILTREATAVPEGENKDKKVILVDPGHGGMDPGMIGMGNLEEKGINLSVAKKVKACLEKEGFSVVMTRTEDKGLYEEELPDKKLQDLQNRIALIEKTKPVLSVSIHQNSYQDPAVCGPQVFYYTGSIEGKKLAESLQESLNQKLEIKRPRVVKGNTGYYLLKKSPGILAIAECGFLTNPEEAEKLQTEEYQTTVAEAISEGICRYLKLDEEKKRSEE